VGLNIASFEKSIEDLFNKDLKAVALNSGTSAIHLALKMLHIGAGDEVICQTFNFCATVNPILYFGASPIFIESVQETWNMCPVSFAPSRLFKRIFILRR
jgi:dTDP-4-amino-4,6-dideoxygalactose transaminase